MRRALCVVSLIVLGSLAAAVPASAQTVEFNAHLQAPFGIRNNGQCSFCGSAHIDGFGKASTTFTLTSFVPNGCTTITGVGRFTLDRDGSTLDIAVEAALCYPGASNEAPDDVHTPSQGDPFQATGTFEFSGGTGVFANAARGGTVTGIGAGDSIVLDYTGTITRP